MTKILEFEQQLALIMMTIEQQRDFSTNYHEITIGDLARLATFADFNWETFLNGFFGENAIDATERIAIYAKDYYSSLPEIIAKTDYQVLHNYVAWISIKPLIYTLSDDFQKLTPFFSLYVFLYMTAFFRIIFGHFEAHEIL